MHILWCMDSKFCVRFQGAPLKFHTKFWTHTPQNIHFTDFYVCVWFMISLNCDVISLSETGPILHHVMAHHVLFHFRKSQLSSVTIPLHTRNATRNSQMLLTTDDVDVTHGMTKADSIVIPIWNHWHHLTRKLVLLQRGWLNHSELIYWQS